MQKFRLHSAIAIAALVTALGSLPLASQGGFLWLLPLVPVVVAVWAWRVGTDADQRGLFIRKFLGTRTIKWDEVSAFVPERRKVKAVLNDGTRVQLTGVGPRDLTRLVGASGQLTQQA